MNRPLPACFLLALALLNVPLARGEEPQNLVANPGFEEDLSVAWEKRTPDDATRKLDRLRGASHSGSCCLVLENRKKTFTRLRQGANRGLAIPARSLVELSAWVKPELAQDGKAGVQLYSMDEQGKILAQPRSEISARDGQWRRLRLVAPIPRGARYSMVYLQIDGGPGKACFDDVELRVIRQPRPEEPAPKIALVTDLAESDECYQNVKLLVGDGLVRLGGESIASQLADCKAAVVLVRFEQISSPTLRALADFARQGRPVFMDLRSLAAWRGISVVKTRLAVPAGSRSRGPASDSIAEQMGLGLEVVKASPITEGFEAGQTIPYAGADGKLLTLEPTRSGNNEPLALDSFGARGKGRKEPGEEKGEIEVIATAGGKPALVQIALGKGRIVAVDLLSLREPYFANVDAYYKYYFLVNTLAGPERVVLAEYYPRKFTYAEFVRRMRETARRYPALRFQEEGPACGEYKLYSLNIGQPGMPLYFLYGATHGSEWEPAYGLLTFAKRVAEGRLGDTIDLKKVCIKIVPILNPSGYDLRQRHNAHGVDLNRNGDYHWEDYQGRDSTGDGRYGPGDYDWKGERPFSEPETQTYRRIVSDPNFYCVLDFHGNTSAASNKMAIVPATAREDNQGRVMELQDLVNQRLRMRYVLRQNDEKGFSRYLLDRVSRDQDRPVLQNTAANGRYGLLVELTAGYRGSYGTVLQTEVTCEICRALFQAFPAQ